MQIKLTSPKSEVLDYCTRLWKRGANHTSYLKWRQEAASGRGLYAGGLDQWHPADLEALRENKEFPITVNVIAGFVDTLCGVETQSRYRTIARIDENGKDARELGRALTQFLLNWQENEDVTYLDAIKFRDTLIGGLSWSAVYGENSAIKYERVEPFEIIFDANDITPQFTDSDEN